MEELRGEGTVYPQKGSRFLWIQYYANGKRIRESTKTDDEKKARKILRQRLVAVENGEISAGSGCSLSSLYEALERDYSSRLGRLNDRLLLIRDSIRADSLRRDSLARARKVIP